ncbi:hypothetical protein BDV37DRAFT_295350 [Aspergillus pseudonomiae]|uniref:Fibronectin type-III domain-containing protein n=1 Tax=Aspergillus pseudonomiae TaxID=1506151 RepID=A0A5N7D872_9EURO|nr:uncharacterized protein BDV37DRAFT_295350 [Aspergillus pseudonomiae]KAE8402489.1 hypothetical protein BDV37DRAFT_295350 [Aspergillus pseudonomiae]
MPPLQTYEAKDNTLQMMAAIRDSIRTDSDTGMTVNGLIGRGNALRVMIVGDSMTQGQEGDYTWRYRIWQWFKEQGVAVDFVGPYTGTVQPDHPAAPALPPLYGQKPLPGKPKTSGGYAADVSSDFDKDHFAVWGRAAAVDKGLIYDVLSTYPADLMLIMLGFNDMGWFYSDSGGTLDSINTLVTNARSANPKLKFAIANVPQRSFIGGREDLPVSTNIYNALLRDSIPKWSTADSPISLVKLQENYDCEPSGCAAGYDGLHPTARGEYQIAHAFTRTLVKDFKIGSSPLSIPDSLPGRPLSVPSNFKVFTSATGVTATWDPVYGAYSYDVQSRIQGGIPNFSAGSVSTPRWDSTWPIDGWVYEVRVRASAGDNIKGDWTSVLSATAHPQTAAAPRNVVVKATTTGFDISWDPPTGAYTDSIIEYNVLYWDKSVDCTFITGGAFTGTSGHIGNLKSGHYYFIAIETWNSAGEGFPAIVTGVVPGAGTPAPPTDLKIFANDPTTVHMTWGKSANAAGYRLWNRNVHDSTSVLTAQNGTVETTCSDQYFLFPGTWNYEWCVSAFNGGLESERGACVLAPSPTAGGNAAQTCPPPPAWCPNGGGAGDGGSGGGGGGGSTSPPTPVPTGDQPWPVVTNGHCKGPDCKGGQCTGLLCASFGCTGTGCLNGVWCIGPGCKDGVCISSGCITAGCCSGDRCIALGCSGLDCGKDGVCHGPNCWEGTCSGAGCVSGTCTGSADCSTGGGGSCTGDDCSSCTGQGCEDGKCTGDDCNACKGKDCHDGRCIGEDCVSCSGKDCSPSSGSCTGPHCSACVGIHCPHCTACSGLGCSCSGLLGLFCKCISSGCTGCSGAGCGCLGSSCGCSGPSCSSCSGNGCTCYDPEGCSGGKDTGSTTTKEPTTCATSVTATNCKVGCSVTNYGDTSRTTACFTTECSTTLGCETKGTTATTATTTNLCPLTTDPAPIGTWDPNGPIPTLGSDNQYTASGKGTTTTKPTTTTSSQPSGTTSIPIPTVSDPGSFPVYCFKEHNDGSFASFNTDSVSSAVSSLCGSGNTLSPKGPPYNYVYSGQKGINVIASLQWADNQSGCRPEKGFKLCTSAYEKIVSNCDKGNADKYGGAFIVSSDDGCIQWMVYAQKAESKCSCNENGCTPESPACCASGTCGTDKQVTLAVVQFIDASEVDTLFSSRLNSFLEEGSQSTTIP